MSRGNLFLLQKPAEIVPANVLPTNCDVISAIQYEKIYNNKSYREAKVSVRDQIVAIWRRASLPIISEVGVLKKINTFHSDYLKLCQTDGSRRNTSVFNQKCEEFVVCGGDRTIFLSHTGDLIIWNLFLGDRQHFVRYINVQMFVISRLQMRKGQQGTWN